MIIRWLQWTVEIHPHYRTTPSYPVDAGHLPVPNLLLRGSPRTMERTQGLWDRRLLSDRIWLTERGMQFDQLQILVKTETTEWQCVRSLTRGLISRRGRFFYPHISFAFLTRWLFEQNLAKRVKYRRILDTRCSTVSTTFPGGLFWTIRMDHLIVGHAFLGNSKKLWEGCLTRKAEIVLPVRTTKRILAPQGSTHGGTITLIESVLLMTCEPCFCLCFSYSNDFWEGALFGDNPVSVG